MPLLTSYYPTELQKPWQRGSTATRHDFKANVEEKRAVLMRLKKLDDNFLPLHSITKLV